MMYSNMPPCSGGFYLFKEIASNAFRANEYYYLPCLKVCYPSQVQGATYHYKCPHLAGYVKEYLYLHAVTVKNNRGVELEGEE